MAKVLLGQASPALLPLPARGQVDYWDRELPGFGLRVSQGGAKAWVVMARSSGRKRRITLGSYPALSLESARQLRSAVLEAPAGPVDAISGALPPGEQQARRPGRPRRGARTEPLAESRLTPEDASAAVDRALFEHAPVAMLLAKGERVSRANAAAAALLGALGPGLLVDQPLASFVHPADRARFASAVLAEGTLAEGAMRVLRLRLLRMDGTPFPAEVAGAVLPAPAGPVLQLTVEDVSEAERELEALRRAAQHNEDSGRAKTEFLATLSHEVRTPLAAVIGTLRLLCETPLAPDQRRHASTALEAADAMLAILNDALDLSKAEAGRLELLEVPFEPRALCESVVDLFAPSARAKGLALRTVIGEGTPRAVRGDAGRLRQVLLNLVSNAIKFTEIGEIELGLACPGEVAGRARLAFAVRDTGIGIPLDARARVFEAFSQLDQPSAQRRAGTGLGLAICRRLVRLMGGEIEFESAPGSGSRFHFDLTLPVVRSTKSSAEPTAAAAAAGPIAPGPAEQALPLQHPVRVLLCDDDAVSRGLTVAMLSHARYRLVIVESGEAAVRAVREGDFDLVIMDVVMPGMSGMDATRAIRALPGRAGRVPIAAMTAHAFDWHRTRCLDAGMNAYLTKPMDRAELTATIERLIDAEPEAALVPRAALPLTAMDDAAASLFDRAVLDQLERDTGTDTLRSLVRTFIDETRLRLARMTHALEVGELKGLARDAHSLRSSAETFGAHELGRAAGELEAAALAARTEAAADIMTRLFAVALPTLEAFEPVGRA